MRLLTNIIVLIFLLALGSCNSTKNADEKAAAKTNSETTSAQKMMNDGFIKGVVIESKKEGDCPFTIQADNVDAYLLDPLNLDSKFMKNGQKIWIKYIPSRMANRCNNANPVQIEKIMKREE